MTNDIVFGQTTPISLLGFYRESFSMGSSFPARAPAALNWAIAFPALFL
jgi:hypothetical protein